MSAKATRPAGTGNKQQRAPLRRAKNWRAEAPAIAGKLLLITVAVVVLGLMFSALQMIENTLLRDGLSLLIASGMALLFYAEGMNKGTRDAGESRQLARLQKAGNPIEAREDAACYHPLKALTACAMVFIIPLLCAIFLALTVKEYTYSLQDLPAWLTGSYGARQDVMAPLSAYMQNTGATAQDWIRVFVRLFVLIFVNLFPDPQRMSATIDRVAPLLMLVYPLAFMIGYLRGPAANDKLESQHRKAKKVAVRKQKKSNLAAELVGDANAPHYGQQRESDKPKKKELI